MTLRGPNVMPRNPYSRRQAQRGCGTVVLVVLAIIVFVAAVSTVNAWVFMVLWGAILSQFGVRTIGYGTSYLICLALGFIGSFFRAAVRH